MACLLDADVFIRAKNLHYGLDFCPAFWRPGTSGICSGAKKEWALTATRHWGRRHRQEGGPKLDRLFWEGGGARIAEPITIGEPAITIVREPLTVVEESLTIVDLAVVIVREALRRG